MSKFKSDTQGDTAVQERIQTKEPPMFKVILLNDNYTSMEFVVLVLESIFNKSGQEAQQIMLSVHQKGSGVAGVYTKEIAETKIAIVHHLAKQNDFPLKCTMEPA